MAGVDDRLGEVPAATLEDPVALRPTRVRYMVLAAACSVALITYVHRVGFATGAPEIKRNLGLSDDQLGTLLAVFFIAYGAFQIPGGWLVDRFGARHLLTCLVFGWSLTTGALALVVFVPGLRAQFLFLVVLRFLFGVFQAGGFPVLSRINADWMPVSRRGASQGMIWTSSRVGGALVPLALAPMFPYFGNWQTPFWILAGLGFAWCVVFWPWFRNQPDEMPQVNRSERALIAQGRIAVAKGRPPVPWSRLLGSLSAWCLCLSYGFGGFAANFYVGWMPTYLEQQRHLSPATTKWITSLPLAFGVVSCITGGVMSDWMIRRTGSRRWGRKLNGMIGMFVAALCFLSTVWVEDPLWLGALFCLTFFANDQSMAPAWACCADIGEQAAGTLGGCMNTMANLGGALGAMVAGRLFQLHHPDWVFPIYAASFLLAGLSWLGVNADKKLADA
jgi:sugar phosphate permease